MAPLGCRRGAAHPIPHPLILPPSAPSSPAPLDRQPYQHCIVIIISITITILISIANIAIIRVIAIATYSTHRT